MPSIEYRDTRAMLAQFGFHFRSMFSCLWLAIVYFCANRVAYVVSKFRALLNWIDDTFPSTTGWVVYHCKAIARHRQALGRRFAFSLVTGVMLGQLPWMAALAKGIV